MRTQYLQDTLECRLQMLLDEEGMYSLTDSSHLEHQYHDSSNLDARIALHRRFSTNRYGFYPWYLDHLDVPANARILEVGAGSGALWQEVAAHIPSGWQITLTDLSSGMLAGAERHLAHIRPFTFVQADAQEIPFPHETFDAVLANHMLYHVPDRPRALAEFRRVLKPGGHLYAATNGSDHLKELRALLAEYTEQMPVEGGLGFGLDNGADQLAPYFEYIELHRYPDAFHITEAEPLRAYIRSMSDQWPIPAGSKAALDRRIDEMLAEGPIHIDKEAGMFTARRHHPSMLVLANGASGRGLFPQSKTYSWRSAGMGSNIGAARSLRRVYTRPTIATVDGVNAWATGIDPGAE